MFGKEKASNDLNHLLKKKKKGGEGRSKAQWPMECFKLGGQ